VKLVYTPQAAADLGEIFNYIDTRHPPGALKVKKAIHDTINLLEHLP